jgi:rhodanese-related sulfurtransferase
MIKTKYALLLTLYFFISFISAEELGNLSLGQLKSMQQSDNALIIDIRTEKEWDATGTIPNSHKLQFFTTDGNYDAEKWINNLNQLKTADDQPVILVCRSGNRSGMVGNMLAKKMGMKNIYHLSNGIMPWIKAGNDTSKDCSEKKSC